jgi:hypothetical protein
MSESQFKIGDSLTDGQANSTNTFRVGDTVTYEMWDGEEGRGYGWFLAQKKAKIVSICYKLDNGDTVEEKKLVKVVESKSESPKTTQNGSTG